MLATGLRALQVLLVLASLYLVWGAVSPLVGATPVVEVELGPVTPQEETPDRELSSYAVIGERNLFQSREAPPTATPVQEQLEESKLRIRLLATGAASRADLSVAVVEDTASRERGLVRVGDEVAGARVARIDRRRLVIENGGKLEQISLEDSARSSRADASTPSATRAARDARLAARRAAARSRARSRARRTQAAQTVPQRIEREPDAQALDLGAFMSGNAQALREGERLTAVNGVPVGDAARGAELIEVISQPGVKRLTIVDADGHERELDLEIP